MTVSRPRVVGILQARMGSVRLPGKALLSIGNTSMLELIVKRVLPAESLDLLVVATTNLEADNSIAELADTLGIPCFRGSSEDVLDRYYCAAISHKADVVVRLTGDNPFVDANLIDLAVQEFFLSNPPVDYLDTAISNTFPIGVCVEVFSFDALEKAWNVDTHSEWREHVTTYIVKNPHLFNIGTVAHSIDLSSIRFTVDTTEDLELARTIFGFLGSNTFSWQEAVTAVEKNPQWLEINRGVQQRTI